jgi:hypothetical protein
MAFRIEAKHAFDFRRNCDAVANGLDGISIATNKDKQTTRLVPRSVITVEPLEAVR